MKRKKGCVNLSIKFEAGFHGFLLSQLPKLENSENSGSLD